MGRGLNEVSRFPFSHMLDAQERAPTCSMLREEPLSNKKKEIDLSDTK